MEKIKVLVVPSDHYGVGLYRSVSPHTKLNELYGDEFDVDIEYEPKWATPEVYNDYKIVHFHKGLYRDMQSFYNAMKYFKENNIVTIMDIDDYWELPVTHGAYYQHKVSGAKDLIINNLKLADYVTTTTEFFAEKIRPYNSNVFVFPNSVDPDEDQYQPIKNMSERIRFGFVMGSAHEHDMALFKDAVAKLPKEILDKIQIVLCGYDLNGTMTVLDKDGHVMETRPIKPDETVWYRYEKVVTDNYKIVSDDYKAFLLKALPNVQWPNVENEAYRREWTKDISSFATHYRNIDVLLVPLVENSFNYVKSELKLIEAGFTHTAVIASNYGPYKIGTKSMFEKNGVFNDDGNCILIDNKKAHKDWTKYIKKLVENPELITKLQHNLAETVKDKYNIKNVTRDRAEWYKSIIKK